MYLTKRNIQKFVIDLSGKKYLGLQNKMGKNNDSNPTIDISRVVATSSRAKLGNNQSAETRNHISTRPIRICRTLEKPKIEIFSSAYLSIKELLEKAKIITESSVSPFYKSRLEKYWNVYKNFCKRFDLDPENTQEDEILAFDPLPMTALRYYLDMPPIWQDRLMYKRDLALVALGLRTIRRPGELSDLSLRDIRWNNEEILWQYLVVYPKTGPEDPLILSNQERKMIRGATAAMITGISLTQIRAIGGWDSKVVMLYLRMFSIAI
ncbi:12243_t:CDS:2 [Cetraspora pellucida]|uniref:12243_t:CDS:1 n=1 Tax=Cetraspora pellucida TaxID=1433469 RepID=A0A9N8WC37_9GLOM|nr:12243_t:CDS:2 [Cetraspora pellucida]